MATSIRCYDCRAFFDIKQLQCTECGAPRRGFNSYLYTAKMNNHLFAQAESAERERKVASAMARGYEPEPPRWARQAAKKIVADL